MQRELAMNTQGLLMDISAYICILKHSSNVVAQLTKMCRPVGCRPVRLSPSRLSSSWFVAQMIVHLTEDAGACCSVMQDDSNVRSAKIPNQIPDAKCEIFNCQNYDLEFRVPNTNRNR